MSNSLRLLIDRLHGNNIHPSGEELADVLWLALRMGELETAQTILKQVDEAKVPPTMPAEQPAEPIMPSQPASGAAVTVPAEEQRVPLYVEASPSVTAPATETNEERPSIGARPFRAPAVPALPDSLGLSRALRPLMRRVPSRSRHILDETATAERYADRGLWLPVFKGRPERWLELALVIDASPSMRLWHPTVAELYQLLARHGAFRDVRRWQLGVDTRGNPVLNKGSVNTPRCSEELLHPEGRHLVIVVSDYAAPPWYTGVYDRWLRLWSRNQPLALLHLLPPRFWLRGGLQRTRLAQFRALAPGLPNPQLLHDITRLPADPVLLPVFTLEPESVALWARLLAGSGETRCPGVVLDRTVVSLPPASGQEMTVQERLRYFRSSASPEAQTLARYCAVLPLTLPVMRLLQAEMLPHSRQVHLAEVFFSGLLLRKNPQETEPEWFIYEFRPGLRDKLLDTLRAPLILDIHQRLSEAVRRNLGRIADFPAFIPDLLVEGGLRLDERSLPFAEVGVTVLRRLGGHYVERAERLTVEIEKLRAAAAARLGATPPTRVTHPSEPEPEREFSKEYSKLRQFLEEQSWNKADQETIALMLKLADKEKQGYLSVQDIQTFPCADLRAIDHLWFKYSGGKFGFRVQKQIFDKYNTSEWYQIFTLLGWINKKLEESFKNTFEFDYRWDDRYLEFSINAPSGHLPSFKVFKQSVEFPSSEIRAEDLGRMPEGFFRMQYYENKRRFTISAMEEQKELTAIAISSLISRLTKCFEAKMENGAATEEQPNQPFQVFQDRLKDSTVAPEMVYLPGGTFEMGDSQGKGDDWERPVHEVTLNAFAIGRYPVTVGEFRRFVEVTGYRTEAEQKEGAWVWDGKEWRQKSDANWRNPYFSQYDRHPVVCISWNDAVAYCQWLSEQTSEQYLLPSEAEWEYACRASSETAYCFGDDERLLNEYAWYSDNSEGGTHPVGEKKANRWGLYDMHGNFWSWVQDWFEDYSNESQCNPSGPKSGFHRHRVLRGGGWDSVASRCRSACRRGGEPGDRASDLGFRLARRV